MRAARVIRLTQPGHAMHYSDISQAVIDSAMRVHTKLGPGLLESAYEACLIYELTRRGLGAAQQVPLALRYDDLQLDVGYRIDVLVDQKVVLELKAIERLLPIHAAQLLSYLRLGNYQLGFLLNFNTVHLRDGIRRVVNRYQAGAPE